MHEQCVLVYYIELSVLILISIRSSSTKQDFPEPDRFIEKVVQHEIVVRDGEDTRMPCDILPSLHLQNQDKIEDRPTLIIWYKKDQNLPLYSLDLRKYSETNPGIHWRNQNSTGRGRIQYEEKGKVRISHLYLPTVTREDAGKYRCRVDYMQFPTKNSWVKLKVIVGPSKPVLRDTMGNIIEDSLLVQQGVSATLLCTTKGLPLPTLLWKLGGKPVQPLSYHTDTITGEVKSKVYIKAEELGRDGAIVECQASNSDRSAEPVWTRSWIRPLSPPGRVKLLRDREFFKAGHRYNVSCLVTGVKEKPEVSISLKSTQLHIHTLQVTPGKEEWLAVAQFQPREEDLMNESEESTDQFISLIDSPFSPVDPPFGLIDPPFSLIDPPFSPVHAIEYKEVPGGAQLADTGLQLTNGARAPNGFRVPDGARAPDGAGVPEGFRAPDGTRALDGARAPESEVTLECRGSNPLLPHQALVDTWAFPLHYGPHIQLYLENKGPVHEGDNVYLRCQVSSFPPYQTIQWYRQNEDLEYKTEGNLIIQGDRLYIRGVQREQAGNYVCRASNLVYSQKSNMAELRVADKILLEVRDCKTLNQSSTSFSVDCSWTGDTGHSTFIFEVYRSDGKELVANLTRGSPRLILANLSPSTDFILTLRPGDPEVENFSPITMETFTLRSEQVAATTGVSNPEYIRLLPILGTLLGLLLVLSVLPLTVHLLVKHRDQLHAQRRDSPDHDCMQLTATARPTLLQYKCTPEYSMTPECTVTTALTPPEPFITAFSTSTGDLQRGPEDQRPRLKSILKDRHLSCLGSEGVSPPGHGQSTYSKRENYYEGFREV